MEAPKCRGCGKREWQHRCGSGDTTPLGSVVGVFNMPEISVPTRAEIGAAVSPVTEVCGSPCLDAGSLEMEKLNPVKFDRVAYMREYMRKRRAAKKG